MIYFKNPNIIDYHDINLFIKKMYCIYYYGNELKKFFEENDIKFFYSKINYFNINDEYKKIKLCSDIFYNKCYKLFIKIRKIMDNYIYYTYYESINNFCIFSDYNFLNNKLIDDLNNFSNIIFMIKYCLKSNFYKNKYNLNW